MLTFATRLMFALLVVLPACSMAEDATSEPVTTAGDESGDEGSDEGDPLDEETATKAEAPPEDEGDSAGEESAPPELLLACDLAYPCEYPVELVRQSNDQSYADSDVCALRALADGTPGLVQTVAAFADAESYLDHVVVAPGEVLRQAHGRSDGVGLWQKPVERCTLRDAAFFADCAQSYDPACLDPAAWVDTCEVLGDLTCPQA